MGNLQSTHVVVLVILALTLQLFSRHYASTMPIDIYRMYSVYLCMRFDVNKLHNGSSNWAIGNLSIVIETIVVWSECKCPYSNLKSSNYSDVFCSYYIFRLVNIVSDDPASQNVTQAINILILSFSLKTEMEKLLVVIYRENCTHIVW